MILLLKPTRCKLKHRERIYIIPLGDLHIGSTHSNECFIKYALNRIKKIKSPKIIYLMGDLIEVATKRLADSVYMQDITVDEQIKTVKKYFKPFKKNIAYILQGNHEARLKNDHDLNVTRCIAEYLQTQYGYQTFDRIMINDEPLDIFLYHGKGGSMRPETAISKVKRDTNNILADLYLYGHLHFLLDWSEDIRSYDGVRKRHYVMTGHFLSYDGSYAERNLSYYQPEGFPIIKVNKDRVIEVKTYFVHNRKPSCIKKR